ncbi:LysR family transcriptional regulator [Candidimonas nitroreducens]|uniref:LysR family transcriptional regulator n=1 Tax=Candidimonas nitroreducens TaxID=683354 RepID=A0A225MBA3_9BURK|nr:LysR family transcriptional regulator [Candidimonas nitroreducens]OWT56891.1 LysR family transcriptional regulator [Candidimonas nitroreducens]
MIRELKTFIAVAQEGSFAAAGNKIGLTQSAVSAQMQRLENELGLALFERAGRSARISTAGRQVLEQAQELVRLYSHLGSAQAGTTPGGLVTLGAIASVQRSLVPDALARFYRRYPGCRTRIVPGLSIELVNLVDAGEIDMAAIIRPPFSLQSDLQCTVLAREPFRLITPRGVPGSDWAELLASQPFIRYERTSFGGRQVDRFLRGMHLTPHELCEADELETIVKLVANGVGIALLPQTAAFRRWPAGVRAIDLAQHTFHRDIVLVHRAEQTLAEPALALVQLLERQAAR